VPIYRNVRTIVRDAKRIADVFDIRSSGRWTYAAEASTVLSTTTLALAEGPNIEPRHGAEYWDRVTAGFNCSEADQVPTAQFNRLLWAGLMGSRPYPALRGQTARTKGQDRH
jgi:hypothetical protein